MKKAFFQLHLAVFLAGFTGMLGRLITLDETMLVWWRLLITAVTMWVLFLLQKKIQRLPLNEIGNIAAVGVLASLHWVSFFGSIKYANVSVALICFSSIGFFTAIFEPLIMKEKFNRMEFLLGLITVAAIYIIFRFDTQYKAGIILGMISAVLGALFPIYNRRLLQRINIETMLTWQQTAGLLFLCLCIPFMPSQFAPERMMPTMNDLGWLLILSWVCSVWAFQLSSFALKRLSAFTVNLTYNLEPVYGILLAFIIFKENKFLSQWFYIGFAIIMIVLLLHVYLLRRTNRKITSS